MPNFNTDPNHKRVSGAAAIVLESGAVYSLCLTLLIVLYMLKTWPADVVLDAMPQVIVSNLTVNNSIGSLNIFVIQ